MLKIKEGIDLKELEKLGFKYGTRDKFIFKTKQNGQETSIYIDLLPCYNQNNKINIQFRSFLIPEKISDKLYDLIKAGLVIKV